MAVLADGVQYGLSSHGLSSENKSLVFVKLTDSSFRAIEEYLRTKLKTQQSPSIQFLGNEGRLWFPNGEDGGGSSFSFNVQPAVAQGSQGSFECVQQCGSRSLESLGVMTLKMNVQAKEDVYEATRQRMAVAEEESKKNCTRVIKVACGPDIGRVVKIRKQAGSVFPPRRERGDASPSHQQQQTSSHRSMSSSTYSSSTHHSHAQTGRSSTSSPSLGGPGGGAAASSNGSNRSSNAISPLPRLSASPSYSASTASSINSSTTSSGTKDGYANGGSAGETNPDLMRRPLRERIIHLLAIRPHKKPELISRLHREGIKEKDKKLIMPILMAVALMKDQAYHLARHIWNDVQDDWPFYTNEEKSILKRRKPQNLTPPVSDSSTGSGNSPPSSSLHSSGSPIRTSSAKTNASPRESGVKRSMPQLEPEIDDMAGAALAAKKQRVSHYKKPDSSQPPVQHQQQPPPPQQHHSAPYQGRDSRSSSSFKSRSAGVYQQTQQQQPAPPPRDHYQREQAAPYGKQPQQQQQQRGHDQYNGHGSSRDNGHNNPKDYYRNGSDARTAPVMDRQSGTSRTMADNPGPETPNSSPESVERMDTIDEPEPYPDYTQLYQRIVSCEQRSRYKEDFNSQYNEYRDLHKIIDRVSKRFAQLEEELRQECEGSSEWQRIKDRIVREYKENLRDAKFLETKRRFHHLHEKLAYIKRLVVEWDSAQTCRS